MPATKFTPALRLVNSSGGVISGPLKLWLPDGEAQGIYLESATPRYAHELLGPYTNTAYTERWRLLGFRPEVDLVFSALRADLPGYALVSGIGQRPSPEAHTRLSSSTPSTIRATFGVACTRPRHGTLARSLGSRGTATP